MKNKILKTFLLDLSYSLLFTFVLIVSRAWIQQFLSKIQSYAPQLNAINPNENTIEAQNLISNINSLANNAYIFIFIAIPLIIFILYVLLQGYSFYLLKKEKKYLLKFALVSLPSFIFIALLAFNPNIYLLIITILTMYLSFFLYFKDFNKLKLAFTKIYKYFPAFLLYLILALTIITLIFVSYISILAQGKYISLFLSALILTLAFSYYKTYLVKLFN